MKILYLHQYFNTPDMSGGTRSYEMARRLVAMGHEVHIVTSNRNEGSGKKDWYEELIDGIHVHWLPVPYSNRMSYSERVKAFFAFALKAYGKAVFIGGDVVFATSTPLTIAIPGVRAAKKLKVPMVFEVRDLWPEVPIAIGALKNPLLIAAAKRLESFAYKNSARVIALSPGMADGVTKTGYPAGRVDIISNSSDLDLFKPDEEKAKGFRAACPELGSGPIVLYPGTLGLINGVSYFPKMAAAVLPHRPDIRFVVLGDGMEWDLVQNEARRLGVLNRNFFLYRQVPKKQVVAAFAAASVVTSFVIDIKELWANSANKFFDALASGTAVAINYGGWQEDLLMEFQAGVALSPDPLLGAAVLVDFFSDADRIRVAGINARRLAEECFSRDVLAARLERVLRESVGLA